MQRSITSILIALAGVSALIASCGSLDSASFDPAPAENLPAAEGVTYEIDGDHTHVVFQVGHLGISRQYGSFRRVAGSFLLADDPAESWVWIAIDPASVDTNVPARDRHIRSADFFDVRRFPDLRFRSSAIEPTGDGRFLVRGDLDFHGVTREISFEMRKTGEGEFGEYGERVAFAGGFTVDRFDHGIDTYEDIVGREIQLDLVVEGLRR